jgi:hypothetical protein
MNLLLLENNIDSATLIRVDQPLINFIFTSLEPKLYNLLFFNRTEWYPPHDICVAYEKFDIVNGVI